MRNHTLVLAAAAVGYLALVSSATSQEAGMLNQAMPAGVSGKVNKVVDGYSELCDAIRGQMLARLKARKDFCPIPMVDPDAHIRRPDWQPVNVDSAADVIGEVVPHLHWSVQSAWDSLKQANPNLTGEGLSAAFWPRYRQPILTALRKRPDLFETTTIDVDNNGSKEEVFRIAALWPTDPKNPDGTWTMRPCNSDYPNGYPAYGFFFKRDKRQELGTLARLDVTGQFTDLFRYRARTFMTRIDESFMADINWTKFLKDPNGSGQTSGFFEQACFIRLDKK